LYSKHELVAQAFIHGDSLQASLVGIIVPDEEVLIKWAKKNGHEEKSFSELCKDAEVKSYIRETLKGFGKEEGLRGFEIVKNIYLTHELFSIENGLLTPTFKLKRHQAKFKYQKEIEAMYAEISQ
jgi:long-chain acyl-CoA synthetase